MEDHLSFASDAMMLSNRGDEVNCSAILERRVEAVCHVFIYLLLDISSLNCSESVSLRNNNSRSKKIDGGNITTYPHQNGRSARYER
jgi:hypothetical protein